MAESSHKQEIRAVRALENAFGLTHSQARRALHAAVARNEKEQQQVVAQTVPKPEVRPPFRIETKETRSNVPTLLPAKSESAVANGSSEPGIPDQTITINNDGDSFVTITGSVEGGFITLNFEWTTTDCA